MNLESWMMIFPILSSLIGYLIAKIQNNNDIIKKLKSQNLSSESRKTLN